MILRRCVCCLGFSRFFFSRISFASVQKHDKKERILLLLLLLLQMPRHSLAREQKKKKRKSLSQEKTRWWCFLIKEEISRRRDFLFLFFSRTKRREKKDTFETKRIISSSSEESARFERTQTHARTHKTQREREKKTTFFSSSLRELFVYCVFVLLARTTEREKERRHFIISPLCKKRL